MKVKCPVWCENKQCTHYGVHELSEECKLTICPLGWIVDKCKEVEETG